MATNKHATIRYHALDQCFSNWGRKYYIEDLIEACNKALYEFSGTVEGIKRRQVFDDIKFMESEQGWSVPLEKIKDGRRVYYRYDDRNFSIKKQAINELEAKQLKETLSVLTRFKGMPQFEWMEEMLIRIESVFKLKGNQISVVSFEQNPFLKGLNFFTDLFNAIQYKKVLTITYKSFRHEEPIKFLLHPYHLKQYNNRWFLFGYTQEHGAITNLALDRIITLSEIAETYVENTDINFEEYFDDIVGVTLRSDQHPQAIRLKINASLWPYIETKPLHGSQKVKTRTDQAIEVELFLQINYEFISLLFSFAEDITVISPQELKNIIKTKAEKVLKNYF